MRFCKDCSEGFPPQRAGRCNRSHVWGLNAETANGQFRTPEVAIARGGTELRHTGVGQERAKQYRKVIRGSGPVSHSCLNYFLKIELKLLYPRRRIQVYRFVHADMTCHLAGRPHEPSPLRRRNIPFLLP